MANLIHVIYASKESVRFDSAMISKLLETSRKNNQASDITGMLAYCEGSFFQVLEGEEKAVEKLFAKIALDDRHEKTVIVIKEPIEERSFENWSMGYASLSKSEASQIEGMNDFFVGGSCLTELDQGRARTLLEAYAEGRWH